MLTEVTKVVQQQAQQIDEAIRVAHLEDSTLIERRLAANPRVLVA